MNIKDELKDTKCPMSYEKAWHKYKQYKQHINGIDLLNSQEIEWQPFEDDEFVQPVPIFVGSPNDSVVYTKLLGSETMLSMVVLEKGYIKYIEHYTADGEKLENQSKGLLHLKFGSFSSQYLKKMTGIITIVSINETIIGADLVPDFEYIQNHKDDSIRKAVYKLYTANWWNGPKT